MAPMAIADACTVVEGTQELAAPTRYTVIVVPAADAGNDAGG